MRGKRYSNMAIRKRIIRFLLNLNLKLRIETDDTERSRLGERYDKLYALHDQLNPKGETQ